MFKQKAFGSAEIQAVQSEIEKIKKENSYTRKGNNTLESDLTDKK
jgi:hypothetical protein